ncbi:EAL domain-containing protein [Pacificimonas sp. WHA3]|uniref:EAL domain-containing protein n=1 Tax=Pacificimonas pallii TaxID=2827236 RepID=A0ABS6SDY0_9SPHN|nr:EAL domain-containing protein [Pacificimonas pallii]MBV7256628.1 EAL domain-containing protein [Pacificimonas pallii]
MSPTARLKSETPLMVRTGSAAALSLVDRGVIDALPIGLALFKLSPKGLPICVEANATFANWAESVEHGLTGQALEKIALLRSSSLVSRYIALSLQGNSLPQGELSWKANVNGELLHLSAALTRRDDHILISVRDRGSEIRAEQHLRMTMLSDDLTGLPNRLRFQELTDRAISKRGKAHVAVLLLNIDRFKRINDSLGHIVGDEFLVALARRLGTCIRGSDRLARLGGDEFALLLSEIASEGETAEIVARLHRRLAIPFQLSGGEVYASATIGIATTLSSSAHVEELMRDANFALSQAKRTGASGVELYQPQDHSKARERFRLEAGLRDALEKNGLTLAYQPLIDLKTGRISGVEALSRWISEEHGFVSPADFIPVAEESGLIVPLGRWALETGCRELMKLRTTVPNSEQLQLAVNVSGVQLVRDDIVDAVSQALDRTGMPGNALKIELTESAIVSSPERARDVFVRLKALGCMIAMDDFGTGYSSLSYLQKLPIDILKIDRSFVDGMLKSTDSQNIVRAILSLSKALGMTTVAEGIETEGQRDALALAGCEIGQGYYFDRPLSIEDLTTRLSS